MFFKEIIKLIIIVVINFVLISYNLIDTSSASHALLTVISMIAFIVCLIRLLIIFQVRNKNDDGKKDIIILWDKKIRARAIYSSIILHLMLIFFIPKEFNSFPLEILFTPRGMAEKFMEVFAAAVIIYFLLWLAIKSLKKTFNIENIN
tara:strand:+ start:5 stop:448 length:444 start_codon:yes stop_codon:yes gene_type:complete